MALSRDSAQFSSPFSPLSTKAFSELLRWASGRANIDAPPGSTCHISVSDALARGANVSDCLAAGDWTGVQTFFRHYLRPRCDISDYRDNGKDGPAETEEQGRQKRRAEEPSSLLPFT